MSGQCLQEKLGDNGGYSGEKVRAARSLKRLRDARHLHPRGEILRVNLIHIGCDTASAWAVPSLCQSRSSLRG